MEQRNKAIQGRQLWGLRGRIGHRTLQATLLRASYPTDWETDFRRADWFYKAWFSSLNCSFFQLILL